MFSASPRTAARLGLLDYAAFGVVATYLGGALLFLLVTKRLDPNVSLRSLLRSPILRRVRPWRGPRPLVKVYHEDGYCYAAPVDVSLVSDREGRSRLRVYEDSRPLPTPHALHETIRREGRGAFSHWGDLVYFSTSDNTDPRTNSRAYTVAEV
jgi:hypothetical protein